jgi:dUTP pyrophosphatase
MDKQLEFKFDIYDITTPPIILIDNNTIEGYVNCIDYLEEYKKKYKENLPDNFETYYNILLRRMYNEIPTIYFRKTLENAVIPSKTRITDEGYDLTIIKKIKDISPITAMYTTGICIETDYRYYTEIVPRSSISKSGYILSNNIGIIDKSYRGELMIVVTKIDNHLPDLQLPFRCAQLLIKKSYHYILKQQDNLNETDRNNGGFGSTG